MPKFAFYDTTVPAPSPVIGWFDTDSFTYPNPPSQDALLELTSDQWVRHYSGTWAVSDGILVSYTSPATVTGTLIAKLGAGISITSNSNSALNSTYALDPVTMNQIGPVAQDFAAGLGLPGGIATFTYPDINAVPRTFTGAQLVALYVAQRNLLFSLNTQAAIGNNGGTPAWPSQNANIA